MHSKDKGDLSEVMIMAALMRRGETVLKPIGDNRRYDLVIERAGVFQRVQCKTGRLKNGAILFNTASTYFHSGGGRRGYAGEVEYFGVYCHALDRCYLVPFLSAKTTAALRVDPTKNTQKAKIRYAQDYQL